MAQRFSVHKNGEVCYDIVLEQSFAALGEEIRLLKLQNRKICIVTDSNVAPLYQDEVKEQLTAWCSAVHTFIIPAGEAYKNLDTVKSLYEFLIEHHFDRLDVLVALGGGVIGDLCGYGAATYLRGIDFIQIPTTLLSQVDSSIGGKTGVDFDSYKNMVGAFHMPKLVYSNTAALKTLEEEQFVSGMGEVIKHGLIQDSDYYFWLKEHSVSILNRELDCCESMIGVSDQIKRRIVEEDPTEQGKRALLNFGHTLGHAVEKLMNFQLPHGHCVALGCMAATYLSFQRGLITEEVLQDVISTFDSFGFPVTMAKFHLDLNSVIQATKNDKKVEGNTIKFILLQKIGDGLVDRSVTDEEMKAALIWLQGGLA